MNVFNLIFILGLFLFTRLVMISQIPVSVYWDEASIAYNAYSIATTGADEWGEAFPVHFRAFGEFKLPVFIYTVAIFVKLFGLNEFSIRLPSVIFSFVTLILTYLLSKKLSGKESIALLSCFFLSISPWFFIFSRTGYEVSAGVMFYVLGIYLFLFLKKSGMFLLLSVLSFILSAYSYNSFRIIIPLTLPILIFYQIKDLSFKKNILWIFLSIIILLFSIYPIFRLYTLDSGFSRLEAVGGVNITSFIKNYYSHFSFGFLFVGDSNLRSQQAGFGQIYIVDVIFIVAGLLFVLKNKSKTLFLPLLLMLLAPIPAAITQESPHALRSLSAVPFLCILLAIGVLHLKDLTKKSIFFIPLVIFIYMIFFSNYFMSFLNIYPQDSSKDWQYGYKALIFSYAEKFKDYEKVVVSDEYAQPYIFFLYYLKYDPKKFINEVVFNPVGDWGFSKVKSFNNFVFEKEKNIDPNLFSKNTLIIKSKEASNSAHILDKIIYANGENAFYLYEGAK